MAAQPMKVSILIGADASGAQAGGAIAEQAMEEVAKSADGASAAINRLVGESNDLNKALGGVAPKSDLPAYGAQLDALRAKYNPLFATIQRYRGEVQGIREAHRVGAISANEMAAAISRERQATLASIDAIKGRNAAIQSMRPVNTAVNTRANIPANDDVAGFQTANIAAQFQDIAVTSAMGMSPLQIALQQGTQLSMALGTSGAAGSVRALGAAFMSLISPVSLLTIGFVAAGAAAIQYFTTAESGAEKSQKLLDEQNDVIRKAAQAWGDAVPAFKAYVDQLDRVDKLTAGRNASDILAGKALDGLSGELDDLSGKFAAAMRSFQQGNVDPAFIRDFREAFSNLREKLDEGTASNYDFLRAQSTLGRAMSSAGSRELKDFAASYDGITSAIYRGIEAAQKARAAWIKSVAGGATVQDIIENSQVRIGSNTYSSSVFTPTNPPVPSERPKIELEGSDTAAGARADIVAQVQARQGLLRTQEEELERMRLERQLVGASSRERAVLVAELTAEQELRRQSISILSQEGQAYIANARSIAAARIETERLNQLALSRDPAGQRSNIEEQVRVRQSLLQSQRDEMDALTLEAQMVGASARERAVMTAALQAEQTLRRQGISIMSEEGRAYIENARTMAATRVEIEPQNQLALSRNPAGSRSNIVEQVQARQQLVQSQNDEIEKLRLEAQLIGASESVRANATATLEAEQQLRRQGISLLSQEGQQYVVNAQAIAQARTELERQQAAYQAVQQAGSTMIDQLVVGTGSLKDRLRSMAETLLTTFQQLAIANPLKNQLLGTNLPTLGDLFSGKSASPIGATTTGAMTVTAGTVMVNGATLGAGTFTPNSSLGQVLGVANNNVPAAANANVPLSSSVDAVNALRTSSPTNIEAYIRQSASARGIDPNTAVAVARSEGGLNSWNMQSQYFKNGVQEQSYGPYQLYMGGGLGNRFQQQTGLDPRLAANGPAGVDYALDTASKEGWGAWYGARKAGISDWQGIGRNPGVDQINTSGITKLNTTAQQAASQVNTMGTGALDASKALTDGNNSLLSSITKVSQPAAPVAPPAATTAAPSGGLFPSLFGALGKGISGIGSAFSQLFSGIFGMFFADGAAFEDGDLVPFANGGVVSRPTLFPMTKGRTGLMGEAGPEAIMPLKRGPGGRLGVSMVMPRQMRQGAGSMRMDFRHSSNIVVTGNGDAELKEQLRAAYQDELDVRDRRIRASFPMMMEEWRQNPWARTSG